MIGFFRKLKVYKKRRQVGRQYGNRIGQGIQVQERLVSIRITDKNGTRTVSAVLNKGRKPYGISDVQCCEKTID